MELCPIKVSKLIVLPSSVRVQALFLWLVKVRVVEPGLTVAPAHTSKVGLTESPTEFLCFVILRLLMCSAQKPGSPQIYTIFMFPGFGLRNRFFTLNASILFSLHQRLIARVIAKIVQIR